MHFIKTARLTLRPINPGDAERMYAASKDNELNRLTGTHGKISLDMVHAHCEKIQLAGDRYDFGMILNDEIIGEIVLNDISIPNKSAFMRMAIWQSEKRGLGYGSEALESIIKFAFNSLNLNRIELEVYEFNKHARRLYENLGFKTEGVKRQALWWEGKAYDAISMACLANDS